MGVCVANLWFTWNWIIAQVNNFFFYNAYQLSLIFIAYCDHRNVYIYCYQNLIYPFHNINFNDKATLNTKVSLNSAWLKVKKMGLALIIENVKNVDTVVGSSNGH